MPSKDPFYGTAAWKRARAHVFERDGYRCRKCGRVGKQRGGPARLTAQHRIPRRRAPHLQLDPYNIVALCDRCHGKEDGGRRYGT